MKLCVVGAAVQASELILGQCPCVLIIFIWSILTETVNDDRLLKQATVIATEFAQESSETCKMINCLLIVLDFRIFACLNSTTEYTKNLVTTVKMNLCFYLMRV